MVNNDPSRPSTPPPATSWWKLPLTRAQFDERAAKEAQRMNAVTTTHHVQRREGDA